MKNQGGNQKQQEIPQAGYKKAALFEIRRSECARR